MGGGKCPPKIMILTGVNERTGIREAVCLGGYKADVMRDRGVKETRVSFHWTW